MTVYGLCFCPEHGAQAVEGALEEARFDAEAFLDQFRNPEARPLPVLLGRALYAASSDIFALGKGGGGFYELLFRAYPTPPASVRAVWSNGRRQRTRTVTSPSRTPLSAPSRVCIGA